MALRDLHHPHPLAVALGVRHAEVSPRPFVDVASLLLADDRDRLAAEAAQAGHERRILGAGPVTVQLHEVLEETLDVVEGVRTLGMARQVDGPPDLLVRRLGLDPVELFLQALELAGEPGAAEERQAAQPAQPLAQVSLGFIRHWRRVAERGRGRA